MNFSKTKSGKTRVLVFVSILFALGGVITYFQLFYTSTQVNSHIFKLTNVIPAHSSDIWSVKFSPDGTWVASGSVDSTVRIWNKETGKLILNLKQSSGVTSLVYSPDGNLIATSGYDGKIRLWKLPEGELIKELSGHIGTIWSIDIHPDGKTLASCGEDKTIKLWSIESGELLKTMTGHSLNVWDVKLSPDGTKIVSGSFDKSIKIWDSKTGDLLHNLTDHTQAVVSLAFSPDNKWMVSTSDDKTIKLWDVNTWDLIKTIHVPEHAQASDFSPDNKWLITGGRDKTAIGEFLQNIFGDSQYNKGVSMRLWDVESGQLLQTFSQHANDVNDVAFCSDGKWIATGSSDKTVELWKISD